MQQADDLSGEPEDDVPAFVPQDMGKRSLGFRSLPVRLRFFCERSELLSASRVCRRRCGRQEEGALVGQRNSHPSGDLGRHAGKYGLSLDHLETPNLHLCGTLGFLLRLGAAQHTAVPSQRSRFYRNIGEAPRHRLLPHPRAVPLQDQTAEKQLSAVPRQHQVRAVLCVCVCEPDWLSCL